MAQNEREGGGGGEKKYEDEAMAVGTLFWNVH
jgi:hypothetical protein